MALESNRTTINSRDVDAGKVFPGAIGIFRSVKRCRMWHRAVMHCARGGEGAKKKSSRMWITLVMLSFILNYPFKGGREFIENKGCTQETGWESPPHFIPRSSQSKGWTGILRKADLISSLDIKHLCPSSWRMEIACTAGNRTREKNRH